MLHNITNATGCSMAPPRTLLGCSSLNSALAARRRNASLMISISAAPCALLTPADTHHLRDCAAS